MEQEQITLDVEDVNELLFKVQIVGSRDAAAPVEVRMVCESDDVGYVFAGKSTGNDIMAFTVPAMRGRLTEGTYPSRIEVIIGNKCFVPVRFDSVFKKTLEVVVESIRPKKTVEQQLSVSARPMSVSTLKERREQRLRGPR